MPRLYLTLLGLLLRAGPGLALLRPPAEEEEAGRVLRLPAEEEGRLLRLPAEEEEHLEELDLDDPAFRLVPPAEEGGSRVLRLPAEEEGRMLRLPAEEEEHVEDVEADDRAFRLEQGKGEPWGPPENLMFRERVVWQRAAKEARMNPLFVSAFGRSVGKFPKSWVDKILELNMTKSRNFNFQGSFYSRDVARWRTWIPEFVKMHFGAGDFLRYTDAAKNNYTSLGTFDATGKPGGYRPKDFAGTPKWYDMSLDYFQVMANSNFTLAPRGDRPFSYRFYEAALVHSIPVVFDLDVDLAPTSQVYTRQVPQALRCIGYHYYDVHTNMAQQLQYREAWAEENLRLFIKYQTFIEGDNVPPHCDQRHLIR